MGARGGPQAVGEDQDRGGDEHAGGADRHGQRDGECQQAEPRRSACSPGQRECRGDAERHEGFGACAEVERQPGDEQAERGEHSHAAGVPWQGRAEYAATEREPRGDREQGAGDAQPQRGEADPRQRGEQLLTERERDFGCVPPAVVVSGVAGRGDGPGDRRGPAVVDGERADDGPPAQDRDHRGVDPPQPAPAKTGPPETSTQQQQQRCSGAQQLHGNEHRLRRRRSRAERATDHRRHRQSERAGGIQVGAQLEHLRYRLFAEVDDVPVDVYHRESRRSRLDGDPAVRRGRGNRDRLGLLAGPEQDAAGAAGHRQPAVACAQDRDRSRLRGSCPQHRTRQRGREVQRAIGHGQHRARHRRPARGGPGEGRRLRDDGGERESEGAHHPGDADEDGDPAPGSRHGGPHSVAVRLHACDVRPTGRPPDVTATSWTTGRSDAPQWAPVSVDVRSGECWE